MTPHELMDLPYAGMAEKQLRSAGKWSYTQEEKLEMVFDKMKEAHYELEGAMYDVERLT